LVLVCSYQQRRVSSYLNSVFICLTGNHKSLCYCGEGHSDAHISRVATHSKGYYLWVNTHDAFRYCLGGRCHVGIKYFFRVFGRNNARNTTYNKRWHSKNHLKLTEFYYSWILLCFCICYTEII
jgi:hypothetical protein